MANFDPWVPIANPYQGGAAYGGAINSPFLPGGGFTQGGGVGIGGLGMSVTGPYTPPAPAWNGLFDVAPAARTPGGNGVQWSAGANPQQPRPTGMVSPNVQLDQGIGAAAPQSHSGMTWGYKQNDGRTTTPWATGWR